jgi:hypothetical protein
MTMTTSHTVRTRHHDDVCFDPISSRWDHPISFITLHLFDQFLIRDDAYS